MGYADLFENIFRQNAQFYLTQHPIQHLLAPSEETERNNLQQLASTNPINLTQSRPLSFTRYEAMNIARTKGFLVSNQFQMSTEKAEALCETKKGLFAVQLSKSAQKT